MPGQAKILSPQEIKAVFQLLSSNRDRAIFALGVYTGLRISEICSLRLDQVFTADGVRYVLIVPRLKKKSVVYSEIPIHAKLCQALIAYRRDLGTTSSNSPWLFPSNESESGHFTRKQAHNILSTAFKTLKLENASTHSMRRTLLTTLSRAGVPLRTVQDISGHASLAQLQAYLEVDPEDKQRALSLLRY